MSEIIKDYNRANGHACETGLCGYLLFTKSSIQHGLMLPTECTSIIFFLNPVALKSLYMFCYMRFNIYIFFFDALIFSLSSIFKTTGFRLGRYFTRGRRRFEIYIIFSSTRRQTQCWLIVNYHVVNSRDVFTTEN